MGAAAFTSTSALRAALLNVATYPSIEDFDVSRMTDMKQVFKQTNVRGDADLSKWDVSKVRRGVSIARPAVGVFDDAVGAAQVVAFHFHVHDW